jgi:vacuolar-type H+-ATPase subunit I/STV1
MDSKTTCFPCFKKVLDSEEGIQCDGPCDRWFHRNCVGVSKAEYVKISSDNTNKWNCSRMDCHSSPSADDLKSILSTLSQKIDDLNSKVDRLNDLPDNVVSIREDVKAIHDKFELLEPRIEQLEQRVSVIESRVETKLANVDSLEETLQEINDRNLRQYNVIIYGIKESNQTKVELKKQHDKQEVNNLITKVCPSLNLTHIKFFRIGSTKNNKPRPIKVIFPEVDQARLFCQRFSELSDGVDNQLSVSRDRTRRERNHLQKLREELEERKNGGESDLTIKYINGVPSIIKSKPKNVQSPTVKTN